MSIVLDGSRALAAVMRAASTTLRILADAVDPSGVETLSRVPATPEPWPGYRQMTVAAVVDHLAAQTDARIAVVVLFERTNRNRRGVLTAAERELRRRETAGR